MQKKLIVIPTYNEIKNIAALLDAIFQSIPYAHVLIVDDNSPDNTGQLIDEMIAFNKYNERLFVMHRSGKQGLGTAYIQGFNWGLSNGYDIFISMDADWSHDPKYLPTMLNEILDNDLVIGSRYVHGGSVINWGPLRKIISRGGCLYAQILLLTGVRDLTGGFNCYKRDNLIKIKLDTIISKGYCFQIEMKFRHILLHKKIKEIPIIFHDRIAGASKMSQSIFKEAILNVIRLSFSRHKIKKLMES